MFDLANIKPLRRDQLPEDSLVADGFDEAIIGYAYRLSDPVVIYDRAKCIEILMRPEADGQGMDYEEACEYFSFNVEGAYVGPSTPMFIDVTCTSCGETTDCCECIPEDDQPS